jgi:hypothetical protein
MRASIRTGIVFFILAAIGCTTVTQFRLPPNTAIVVKRQKFIAEKDGYADVKVHPFSWKGASYTLLKDDEVVQTGKLRSSFRVASLFLPPFAIFYWPKGFGSDCYDLTQKTPTGEPGPCVVHETPKRKMRMDARKAWQGGPD